MLWRMCVPYINSFSLMLNILCIVYSFICIAMHIHSSQLALFSLLNSSSLYTASFDGYILFPVNFLHNAYSFVHTFTNYTRKNVVRTIHSLYMYRLYVSMYVILCIDLLCVFS